MWLIVNNAAYQWSADVSEYAHITKIKHPARSGNNQKYESQICCSLDHTNKVCHFDLATSMLASGINFGNSDSDDTQFIDHIHTLNDDVFKMKTVA